MTNAIRDRFSRWKASPKKWKISYIAFGLKSLLCAPSSPKPTNITNDELLTPPIESEYVELLFDPMFRRSVEEVRDYTCLDFARLANLWTLVKMVGPGTFIEVGSYKGGTALHICNAIQHEEVAFYCFDPFENGGFENLGNYDAAFSASDFTDTQYKSVAALLSRKPFARVVQGFFPAAAGGMNLHDVTFCHLDVDTYSATKESLEYLVPRLASRCLIVLDDVGHRETPGVEKALMEFAAAHPSFLAIPMFPCQAILVPKTFWQP